MKKAIISIILLSLSLMEGYGQSISCDSSFVVPYVVATNNSLREIIRSSSEGIQQLRVYCLEFARLFVDDNFPIDAFMLSDIGDNDEILLLSKGEGHWASKGFHLFGCLLDESNQFFVICKDIPDYVLNTLFAKSELSINLIIPKTPKYEQPYVYQCLNRVWFLKDNKFYPFKNGQDLRKAYEEAGIEK